MGFFSPGAVSYRRLEMLKMEQQAQMSDVKKFPKESSEALYKRKYLTEKSSFYQ